MCVCVYFMTVLSTVSRVRVLLEAAGGRWTGRASSMVQMKMPSPEEHLPAARYLHVAEYEYKIKGVLSGAPGAYLPALAREHGPSVEMVQGCD